MDWIKEFGDEIAWRVRFVLNMPALRRLWRRTAKLKMKHYNDIPGGREEFERIMRRITHDDEMARILADDKGLMPDKTIYEMLAELRSITFEACPSCSSTHAGMVMCGRESWMECRDCQLRTRGFFLSADLKMGPEGIEDRQNYSKITEESLRNELLAMEAWNKRVIKSEPHKIVVRVMNEDKLRDVVWNQKTSAVLDTLRKDRLKNYYLCTDSEKWAILLPFALPEREKILPRPWQNQ